MDFEEFAEKCPNRLFEQDSYTKEYYELLCSMTRGIANDWRDDGCRKDICGLWYLRDIIKGYESVVNRREVAGHLRHGGRSLR